MATEKNDFTFEIVEKIGVVGTKKSGWTKEVNVISWKGGAPKLDIREWDPEHEHCSKGVTLNNAEMEVLNRLLMEKYAN